MNDLSKYTDDDLRKELERREFSRMKPTMIEEAVNVRRIRESCKQYIEFLYSDEYHEDEIGDYRNDIFEAVMETMYGLDVWDYINARKWDNK